MSGEVREEAWALPRKRDRFGLRTQRVHSPELMRHIADRLERLRGDRESQATRAYVEAVLGCPYWGLRVLAIRVLAAWGGRGNKRWLMERAERRTSHGQPAGRDGRWHDLETGTARLALRPLLTAEDADWLLQAFFADEGWNFWHLDAALASVQDGVLLSRLEAEITSDDAGRRMAVLRMIAQRRSLPAGPALVRRLAGDGDAAVRGLAEALLRRFEAGGSHAATQAASAQAERRPTRERSRMVGASRDGPGRRPV